MRIIAELHSHSSYANACSDRLNLENIEISASKKGIDVVSTGDFTHPSWIKLLEEKLEEYSKGIYTVKGSKTGIKFVIGGEVNCSYIKDGKARSVHVCVIAEDIGTARQIIDLLSKYGELKSDGRPTLRISLPEFVEKIRSVSKKSLIFPAHIWTPWYGVLGSFSGFNSIAEAFEDKKDEINAIETGLSSDPEMNWMVSELDKYAIISGGDAHSPEKIGRELTALSVADISYDEIFDSIRKKRIEFTIEFYPEEGKYHYDGHRKCGISVNPEEHSGSICPKCKRGLTIGVLHRVMELADRKRGYMPKGAAPFFKTIPLYEVIALAYRKSENSSFVKEKYMGLVEKLGKEVDILLKLGEKEISEYDPIIAKSIKNIREGKVKITPGYDGVFGKIELNESERGKEGQLKLFD
ncbi:MAG: endonuclease Q family protein [Candidatus Micrarchaeaceae archaeon]